VHLKFEVLFFTNQSSRKHNFLRRTSGLAKSVMNFIDSQNVFICRTFFSSKSFSKIGVHLKFEVIWHYEHAYHEASSLSFPYLTGNLKSKLLYAAHHCGCLNCRTKPRQRSWSDLSSLRDGLPAVNGKFNIRQAQRSRGIALLFL